jgi:hypothetical protein
MDCREAQLALHVAPLTDEADVRAHAAHCKACGHLASELIRLECAIRDAALAVRVPEGLSARVLLRKRLGLMKRLRTMLEHLLPTDRFACAARRTCRDE